HCTLNLSLSLSLPLSFSLPYTLTHSHTLSHTHTHTLTLTLTLTLTHTHTHSHTHTPTHTHLTRVGDREPVPIWNRFQYNRYLPRPKCNADFGASFRCLSQLKTVARQIPRGTCKTAPAPNVNVVLCRSRSLVFS